MHRPDSHRPAATPLLVVATAVAALQVPAANAFERRDIACEFEDMTRLISLRVDPDAGYVCDVLYEKPDEGGTREVLWSARNDADYCEPRFDAMVKDLAGRGWTCGYAERADGTGGDEPAIGAAEDERADDDEVRSGGTAGKIRDWCVADVAGGPGAEGSAKGFCNCVADGMDAQGVSEDDARVIFEGLASLGGGAGGGAGDGDKRLNTLATSYATVADSCR